MNSLVIIVVVAIFSPTLVLGSSIQKRDFLEKGKEAFETAKDVAKTAKDATVQAVAGCTINKCVEDITTQWVVYAKMGKAFIKAQEEDGRSSWEKAYQNMMELVEMMKEYYQSEGGSNSGSNNNNYNNSNGNNGNRVNNGERENSNNNNNNNNDGY